MAINKKKQRQRRDKLQGIALVVVGTALVALLGGGAYYLKSRAEPIDQVTNCPLDGPRAVHAVIVDRSDAVTGQQAQRIRQVLIGLKESASVGTRFDIFTFDGNATDELAPVLSVCAPGRPEQANELYENPEMIRRNYQEKFSKVLERTIDQLLTASERPRSPIVESIRAAAITAFGGLREMQSLNVTLISDMIQNSDVLSQLRTDVTFDQLSRSTTWPSLRPHLRGAKVDILYVLRPASLRGKTPVQNRGHQLFWEQLISASGGELVSVEPI